MLTPLVSGQTARLYALKKRWFRHEPLESSSIPDTGLKNHAVIAGGGRLGFQIATVMKRFGMPFVIIELDHRRFLQAKAAGLAIVYGDAGQEIVLDAAGIKDATLLILTIPGVVAAKSTLVQSKRLNGRLEIVARASGPDYVDVFKDLGVAEIVLPEFEAGLEMTRRSLLHLGIPPTEVQRHTDTIRQERYAALFNNNDKYRLLSQLRGAEQQFDLQWVRLAGESPMALRTIGKSEIRKKTGVSIVGVVREGVLKANPDADFVLEPEDLVAIIGNDQGRNSFFLMASCSLGKDDA